MDSERAGLQNALCPASLQKKECPGKLRRAPMVTMSYQGARVLPGGAGAIQGLCHWARAPASALLSLKSAWFSIIHFAFRKHLFKCLLYSHSIPCSTPLSSQAVTQFQNLTEPSLCSNVSSSGGSGAKWLSMCEPSFCFQEMGMVAQTH